MDDKITKDIIKAIKEQAKQEYDTVRIDVLNKMSVGLVYFGADISVVYGGQVYFVEIRFI